MKKIFLVDVSSLFFRAFYAIRPLTAPSGLPTNAIYGFLTMITKILKNEKPDYLVFCYDRKEPSFRKDLYPEYKAHRTETPEDLVPQIPYIKKLADVMGIPSLEVEKYEADDIIGTLVKIGRKHNLEVFIVSGDKDFAQLIEPHVWLYDTMKEIKYDAEGVKEKWGVAPSQMVDYLALTGDSSDNIPGVDGIGAKGAQKLILEYGSLDGIYENLEKIKGATFVKLKNGKASAYLSKKLVTIETEIPVAQDLKTYHLRSIQFSSLKEILHELNFKNLEKTVEALPQYSGQNSETAPQELVQEKTPEKNPEKNQRSSTSDIEEVDVHVADLEKHIKKNQEIWGFLTEHGVYLGLEQDKKVLVFRESPSQYAKALSEFNLHWKGFDLKKFWHALEMPMNHKFTTSWDSMLAAYVIKAGENMESDHVYTRFTGEIPADLLTPAQAFAQQLKLEESLKNKIKEIHAGKVLQAMDFPLISILYCIESRGIRLDVELLRKQGLELTHELQAIEKGTFELSGEVFNMGSPKQLSHILFDKLKLPTGKKTKTGFSTDNDVLEKLKHKHPIVDLVLQYRELSKLKSTYVDALPLLVKEDGRLHTTFHQALTTTGRLSSTDPNLQNIPIRTERGARVRRAFIAEPGKKLLSADYSQIELRILAHYSEDKNLSKAFHDNLDVHTATAAEVFNVALKEVTSEMRRAAKAVNFGIAYGQGSFGLAESLGISRTESSEIINKYFLRFSGVKNYIDEMTKKAEQDGFVETLYGRRRYIDELKSSSPAIKKFGQRAAINAPIQGTASDIMKLAMIELAAQVDINMILQIHDELIFEGAPDELSYHKNKIIKIMENVAKLSVPLKVNASIGDNWDEAH